MLLSTTKYLSTVRVLIGENAGGAVLAAVARLERFLTRVILKIAGTFLRAGCNLSTSKPYILSISLISRFLLFDGSMIRRERVNLSRCCVYGSR